jgi:hypothetical protein
MTYTNKSGSHVHGEDSGWTWKAKKACISFVRE